MSFLKGIFRKNNGLISKSMEKWLDSLDLINNQKAWSLNFNLSTTEIDNWFYSRNKLKPDDVKIELIAPSSGDWVVQLERRDRLFVAQWRKGNDFRIESQQIKFRKLINWPELNDIYDFPNLIKPIEDALDIKFKEHVDVSSYSIDLEPHLNENSNLFKWLESCSKTIGSNMKVDRY